MKRSTSRSRIQSRHLQALLAVANAGSVHTAARSLGVPQPALSRLLTAAEELMGVSLFERSRTGTRVTATGARVIREAALALRAIDRVTEAATEPLPSVRLGCIPRAMHVLMPHLLALTNCHPARIRLHVSVGNSNELAADLQAARLDFVLARRVPGENGCGLDELELEADHLYSEKTVVVCGAKNEFVPRGVAPVRDLARLPWVLPKRGYYSRDLIDRIICEAGLPPLAPVVETQSFESNLSVVAETEFISIAPEFAANRFERLKLVRTLRTRPSMGSNPIMLLYRSAQRDHPAFREFRCTVLKAARRTSEQ